MKLALFVNDSYFSYLLAEPTIKAFHKDIKIVLFSNKHNRSIDKIKSILINHKLKILYL